MPCHVNCQYLSSVDYLYDFQRSLRQKDCLSVGIFHYIFGLGCCAGGNEGTEGLGAEPFQHQMGTFATSSTF